MSGRRAILLLTICFAFLAAAQDEETLTPLPLDEEPVPRGAAITRGVPLRLSFAPEQLRCWQYPLSGVLTAAPVPMRACCSSAKKRS